jgi:simple sugar transport system ATP-binding protein
MNNKNNPFAVEMKEINKAFGQITANKSISFDVKFGEIHVLAGMNGSGKTTLISILYGLHKADSGKIFLSGEEVKINSPIDAKNKGIGIIQQHFSLIEKFSALENVVLGNENCKLFDKIDYDKTREKFLEISKLFHLSLDPDQIIGKSSVSFQQRLELLKVLYCDYKIIIFDEPTAVLTSLEVKHFFKILKKLRDFGKAIIFITHKVSEIKMITDRLTVLKKGKKIGTYTLHEKNEDEISEMIVGKKEIKQIERVEIKKNTSQKPLLKIKNLSFQKQDSVISVNNLSLSVYPGEIVTICGVDNNGQNELAFLISGLLKATSGKIYLNNFLINALSTKLRYQMGISFLPEDRFRYAIIPEEKVSDNCVLRVIEDEPLSFRKVLIDEKEIKNFTNQIIDDFKILGCEQKGKTIINSLSGGNQQKLVLARELVRRNYKLFVALEPTRGLDVLNTVSVYNMLLAEKKVKKAILLFIFDVKEAMRVSDRIFVMRKGKLVREFSKKEFDKHEIEKTMLIKNSNSSFV